MVVFDNLTKKPALEEIKEETLKSLMKRYKLNRSQAYKIFLFFKEEQTKLKLIDSERK